MQQARDATGGRVAGPDGRSPRNLIPFLWPILDVFPLQESSIRVALERCPVQAWNRSSPSPPGEVPRGTSQLLSLAYVARTHAFARGPPVTK